MTDQFLFEPLGEVIPQNLRLTMAELLKVEHLAQQNYQSYGDGTKLAGEKARLTGRNLMVVAWIDAVAAVLHSKNKCDNLRVERDEGSSEPDTEY